MKILELCLSPDFGGLEIYVRDFVTWLAGRDSSAVHLACQSGTRLAEQTAALEIPRLTFPRRGSVLPLRMARQLARYVEANAIGVVHLHWKYDLPLVALARRFSSRPFGVVHSRHMSLPGGKRDPYHRFIYGSVDLYHTITNALREQARTRLPIDAERIETIYLGATVPAPMTAEQVAQRRGEFGIDDRFTVGVVGRISRFKGQHLLVEAVGLLKREGIPVRGLIAGHVMETAEMSALQTMVKEAGLEDDLLFLGFQDDPARLIQCLDALVLTTAKETFGLVLVEAMLLGVPVIGSDAGGVPEIIDHGRTGLLFESGSAAGLADAMRQLATDPASRLRIAAAGKQKAGSKFDRETQFAVLLRRIESTAV